MKEDTRSKIVLKDLIDRAREAKKLRTKNGASSTFKPTFSLTHGENDDNDDDDDEDQMFEGKPTVVEHALDESSLPPLPELNKLKIDDQTATLTMSPAVEPLALKNYKFKAERICRLGIPVLCAEFWGVALFLKC